MSRMSIKIAGESGSLSTAGNIIVECLRKLDYYVYGEREFPSLIKGGRANNQINFAKYPIRALSHNIPVGVALDREWVLDCLDTLADGGVLIHGFDRWPKIIKDLPQRAAAKNLTVYELPARNIAESLGGSAIMVNTVLVGFLFKVLGLDLSPMLDALTTQLSKKPALLKINIECAKAGYDYDSVLPITKTFDIDKTPSSNTTGHIYVDGNSALALGAISAGCRAHYQYPMSPSTTVLISLAAWAEKTGMLVKQAEDEITAIQMALGSMHTGTRAMTATSGGGFDLMTETVSLAGMIETPCVTIIVQRPGPATGLPTWTGQADLNLAIYSGHGEYGKLVIACSDVSNCYENIQHAFNMAEKYQIPVMVLSEACIGMSNTLVPAFDPKLVPIERYLPTDLETLKPTDRYEITESGISTRWIPGTSKAIYFANGDEHHEDGSLDETLGAGDMIEKRIRKLQTIENDLPEPDVYGVEAGADVSFVGWGSTKNAMLDALDQLKLTNPELKVNYLHFNYVYPLKTGKLKQFLANNSNVILIEGNGTGQLGELITIKTGYQFQNKFLKWNGRPFYIEEIMDKVKESL
jgi:2-oxoglutarate/2-oxoacid ferredoxin oxidoreductase subunit alpha